MNNILCSDLQNVIFQGKQANKVYYGNKLVFERTISTGTIGDLFYYDNTLVGIVVVDETITKDGSIRVAALGYAGLGKSVSYTEPQLLYNATTNIPTTSGPSVKMDGDYSSFEDGISASKIIYDKSKQYTSDWSTIISSTFINQLKSSSENRYSEAWMCCYRYGSGSTAYKWYLPSVHELEVYTENINTIKQNISVVSYMNIDILSAYKSNVGAARFPWSSYYQWSSGPAFADYNYAYKYNMGANKIITDFFCYGIDNQASATIPFIKFQKNSLGQFEVVDPYN